MMHEMKLNDKAFNNIKIRYPSFADLFKDIDYRLCGTANIVICR